MYSGIQKLWSVSLLPECPIRLIWYQAPIFLPSDLIFEINSEGQQTQENKKRLPCPNPSPQVIIACLRMEEEEEGIGIFLYENFLLALAGETNLHMCFR